MLVRELLTHLVFPRSLPACYRPHRTAPAHVRLAADCIRGTVELIEAPKAQLKQGTYNMTAISFTPAELARAIAKLRPGFSISYAPDFRQKIADSWPRSIDDSAATRDWNWRPDFNLDNMSADMLAELGKTVKPE